MFQVHAVDAAGVVVMRRQVRRAQLLLFFSRLAPCLIGMEARAGAQSRARALTTLGHGARLRPLPCVKPFVKRGKNDAADAEAICTAVTQPAMRVVPVRTEVQQAMRMSHRARDFLVRQRTRFANTIRAHLAEFGLVVPNGVHDMGRLVAGAEAADLPVEARMPGDLRRDAPTDETARRLQALPGIGPDTASALATTLPDVSAFRSARDLSARPSLASKPHSSAGMERLGAISRMGNRYVRRLFYLRAMAVISARKRADPGEAWLGEMLTKTPPKVVAIALANRRMARQLRAMLRTGEAWPAA